MKLKIKKNDTVRIIAGNDKGKEGRVISVLPEKMRVIVEGINVRKRHTRPSQNNPEGRILSKEMPVHYSNIMLLDSKGSVTRVGSKRTEVDGKQKSVRIARTTGEEI